MKKFTGFLMLLMAKNTFACPEFSFCPGEGAISNDGYLVTIVSMQSNQSATIRTSQGSVLSYQTQYLAKLHGCNSKGFCTGENAITADAHDTRIAGIFGCGSTDVAITTTGTQGGYLRYGSQYLTELSPTPTPANGPGCQ